MYDRTIDGAMYDDYENCGIEHLILIYLLKVFVCVWLHIKEMYFAKETKDLQMVYCFIYVHRINSVKFAHLIELLHKIKIKIVCVLKE